MIDAGPIKEKQLMEELQDGGVRFQSEIPHPDGKSHLDRTTLAPLPGGRVHQVIEISAIRARHGKPCSTPSTGDRDNPVRETIKGPEPELGDFD